MIDNRTTQSRHHNMEQKKSNNEPTGKQFPTTTILIKLFKSTTFPTTTKLNNQLFEIPTTNNESINFNNPLRTN